MTNDKVNQVLTNLAVLFEKRGYAPFRFTVTGVLPSTAAARQHAHWMACEALTFPPEKLGKKMRWLGFVQGVAWLVGDASIEELKNANKSDDAE
jgi:hypothetical protein